MVRKLIFPQEIEVWYILPAIRKQLALELVSSGLNQSQVSRLLDCSRAAITQYTKQKRGQDILPQTIKKQIKSSAKSITENQSTVFKEIMFISQMIKSTGLLCQIHKKLGLIKCKCQSECEVEVEV